MRRHLPFYLTKSGLLSALMAAVFTPHAFAAAAGKIDFAFGKVSATGTDGAMRALNKGSEVFSGDAITTGDGRVQIRFSDGAYMALQPNTIFKVDQYAFNGKQDGTEKGSFSLVKGSMRTITGLIGHVNKQNYEVRTPTATIGIRGTAYTANQSDDGLVVTVGRGLVAVSNQGGNVLISTGQSVLVRTPTSSPEMTDQKAAAIQQAPTQHAQQEEQQQQQQASQQPITENIAAVGEQRAPDGSPAALPVATTGAYAVALGYGRAAGSGISMQNDANAVFDTNHVLTSFSSSSGNIDFTAGQASSSPETRWDGIIGWGRWTGPVSGSVAGANGTYSTNEGIAYVVGKPSTVASLNLSSSPATVNYNFLGASRPVTVAGGIASLGQFIGGSAQITFNTVPTMNLFAEISNSTAGINYSFALTNVGLSLNGGSNATFTAVSSFGVGSGGATININGLFAGTGGDRLGIAYNINDSNKITTGAAAFIKAVP